MANIFSRVGLKNGAEERRHGRLRESLGRYQSPAPAQASRPNAARWQADGPRFPRRPPRSLCQVAHAARTMKCSPAPSSIASGRNFMGRGLVDPVDDVRATNPASNEELFAAATKDFVASGYDIKHLIRTIMNSGAYQLSSESQRHQSERQQVLLQVHRQALTRGGAARLHVGSHQRSFALRRIRGRDARPATSGRTRQVGLPHRLRPSRRASSAMPPNDPRPPASPRPCMSSTATRSTRS